MNTNQILEAILDELQDMNMRISEFEDTGDYGRSEERISNVYRELFKLKDADQ